MGVRYGHLEIFVDVVQHQLFKLRVALVITLLTCRSDATSTCLTDSLGLHLAVLFIGEVGAFGFKAGTVFIRDRSKTLLVSQARSHLHPLDRIRVKTSFTNRSTHIAHVVRDVLGVFLGALSLDFVAAVLPVHRDVSLKSSNFFGAFQVQFASAVLRSFRKLCIEDLASGVSTTDNSTCQSPLERKAHDLLLSAQPVGERDLP